EQGEEAVAVLTEHTPPFLDQGVEVRDRWGLQDADLLKHMGKHLLGAGFQGVASVRLVGPRQRMPSGAIRAARLDLLELSQRPFEPRRAQVLVNVHVVGPAGVLSPQGFPLADRVVEPLRSASGQDSYLLESPGNLPLLSPQRWLVEARRSLA